MKLVIDVSKNDYEDMKKAVSEGVYDYNGTMANLIKSVSNGIILSDNKELDQLFKDICKIRQAKIIFEADKGGE